MMSGFHVRGNLHEILWLLLDVAQADFKGFSNTGEHVLLVEVESGIFP